MSVCEPFNIYIFENQGPQLGHKESPKCQNVALELQRLVYERTLKVHGSLPCPIAITCERETKNHIHINPHLNLKFNINLVSNANNNFSKVINEP